MKIKLKNINITNLRFLNSKFRILNFFNLFFYTFHPFFNFNILKSFSFLIEFKKILNFTNFSWIYKNSPKTNLTRTVHKRVNQEIKITKKNSSWTTKQIKNFSSQKKLSSHSSIVSTNIINLLLFIVPNHKISLSQILYLWIFIQINNNSWLQKE